MADTLFSPGTVIVTPWLNDVNTRTYAVLTAVSAGPNALTANGPSSMLGYSSGILFRFLPQVPNTGPVTLNISGLGVLPVTKYGVIPLMAGDLLQNSWAYVAYDGARFQLLNPVHVPGALISSQTLSATGVYTPTPGTNSIWLRGIGSGGGGGGAPATSAGNVGVAGGGGGGGQGETLLTSGFSGAAVVIGIGGVGGPGASAGGPGGTCSFGGTLLILGGGGGGATGPNSVVSFANGGPGGVTSGGSIYNTPGTNGQTVISSFAQGFCQSGGGGDSPYGSGGRGSFTGAGGVAGLSGSGRGVGGGGACNYGASAAQTGGAGTTGMFLVFEYS